MTEIPTTGTEYTVETGYGTQYTGGYKGLLTGTISAQQLFDGTISPTYLYSVMYYDNRGRLIQAKSNNHLSGGIEQEYIAYNFTGQPIKKMHIHPESQQTMDNYGSLRKFSLPNGEKEIFSLHLIVGDLRIHFYPDNESQKIYIGYIGFHLRTWLY